MVFNKLQQFIQKAKKVRLTPEELKAGRESFMNYTQMHPVRNAASPRHIYQTTPLWQSLLTKRPMFATIAIMLVLALSGGTAAAAEGAVPGSPLYPIKVHVNEEVRAALAASPEAKANWEARRVERRLEEAVKLAEDNTLTASTSEKLAAQFEKQTDRVEKIIEKLKAAGNVEGAAVLEAHIKAALDAHEEILNNLNGKTKAEVKAEIRNTIGPLMRDARERLRELREEHATSTSSTSETGEVKDHLKAMAEHANKKSQHEIDVVTKLIAEVKEKSGTEFTVRAEAKITEANSAHADGVKQLEAGEFKAAIMAFVKANGLAHEAQIILNFHRRFFGRAELIPGTLVTTTVGRLGHLKVEAEANASGTVGHKDDDEDATSTKSAREDNEEHRGVIEKIFPRLETRIENRLKTNLGL